MAEQFLKYPAEIPNISCWVEFHTSRVRPIYWLADISADIFGRYRYIGIGKLDIGIGHIGIGIGIG